MRVSIEIEGETALYEVGATTQTLTEWLRHENLPLNTRCGERGLCRACEVEILGQNGVQVVRACGLALHDGLAVRIPPAARLAYRPQVMASYRIDVPFALASEWGTEGIVAAVDIGTTTVSLTAFDLATGEAIGTASDFNQQITLGDDVLTRISLCRTLDDAMERMTEALWAKTLVPLASQVLGDRLEALTAWTLAGNTTMVHLAIGVNPGPMGVSPFPAPFLESQHLEGYEPALGRPVRVLPNAAAYVGGDIIAGLVATGYAYEEGPALYVDIGTNGEIVFRDGDRMVACATAAGPAFEGSGLSCGVRAGDGAIARVTWSGSDWVTELIGEAGKPIGICGSAYVDFLSEARAAGQLNFSGRATEAAQGLETDEDGSKVFVLGRGVGKRRIGLSEHDIARLIQAKAAIGAGIQTLMESLGVKPGELRALYLAGGFGMHLNIDHAIAIGLLPGFRSDQVRLVGNASLAGAHLAALDRGALEEMSRVAEQIEIIELNLQPGFEDAYLDSLGLDTL